MFLNIYHYFPNILLILILIFFFKLPLYNMFFFDFFFKICVNDPIIAFYSFFWITNSTVIAFIFFLLLVQFFFSKKNILLQMFVCVIYLFYLIELDSFFSTNFLFNFFSQSTIELNFFLNNSLNKYHPFFLYQSVVLFFFNFSPQIINSKSQKIIIFFSNNIIFINLIALFLGAWWAVQEGSWGGWWNWDPSETLGLIIFSICLSFTHLYLMKRLTIFFVYLFISINLIFFFIIYFFVQLNFETTSHNFGIKFFFFFNNNFFLFEIINFLCFLIIFIKILFNFYFFTFKYIFLTIQNLCFKKIINFLIVINLSFLVLYISFAGVINFFCYNLFSFIILTSEFKTFFLFYFYFYLFLFLWQFFDKFIKFSFFFFINKFFIFNVYFKFNIFFFISHYVLYLIIINFFFIEKFNYSIFLTLSDINELYSNLYKSLSISEIICIEDFCINKIKIEYWNKNSQISSFSWINLYLLNTFGLQNLSFSTSQFFTNFYLNSNYSFICLLIELKYSANLFVLFFLFLMFNFLTY